MTVLEVFSLVGSVVIVGLILRVLALVLVTRIRLTDVIGYVTATAGLLTLAVYDWERFGQTAIIGWVAGVVLAVAWTAHTVRARRRDPDHELLGVFLIGKPPHAVRNWVAVPARST